MKRFLPSCFSNAVIVLSLRSHTSTPADSAAWATADSSEYLRIERPSTSLNPGPGLALVHRQRQGVSLDVGGPCFEVRQESQHVGDLGIGEFGGWGEFVLGEGKVGFGSGATGRAELAEPAPLTWSELAPHLLPLARHEA